MKMSTVAVSAETMGISVLGALSSCLASTLLFFTDVVPSNNLVLGVIWALLVTSLDVSFSLAYAIRSIFGAALGGALGVLCQYLADSAVGLAEDTIGTPLSFFFRQDVARLVLYAVASFEADALRMAFAFTLGSSVGYLVTFVAVFVFPMAGCVSRLRLALARFSSAVGHVFECLVAFVTSGPDHLAEAERRLQTLDEALEGVYVAKKSFDLAAWRECDESLTDLIDTLTLMPSQLLAVTHTLDRRFSSEVVQKIWTPIAPAFAELASKVAMTLRNGGVEQALIPTLSDKVYKQLIAAMATLEEEPEDLSRFVFAIVAVVRFARLVNRFARLRAAWISRRPDFRTRLAVSRCVEVLKNLGNGQLWRSTLSSDSIFPLKIAIIDQLAIQLLVLWKNQSSEQDLPANALWAAIPLFFCLLPTFGGSLVKGTRRIIGTAVGGGIALISVIVSSTDDEAALMLELFLLGVVSKLLSLIPFFGYAGLVIFVTWVIVALSNFDSSLTRSESISLTVDRLVLTVLGSVLTAFLGGVVLPKLGMRGNVSSVCRILGTCTELFRGGVEAVLSDRAVLEASSPLPAPELVVQYNAAAGFEANKRMRKDENARRAIAPDAGREANFFRIFRIRGTKKLQRATQRLEKANSEVRKLEHAALVFFATAASTLFDAEVREFLINAEMRESLKSIIAKFSESLSDVIATLEGRLDGKELRHVEFEIKTPFVEKEKLRWALDGGLPRLYAFLFTLEDYANSWNNLIDALTAIDRNK